MIKISEIETDELEKIDYSSLTKSELEDVIKQLENESVVYDTLQMAEKIALNSIYGAFGNEYFYFYDVRLAETITLQGQDAIQYSEKILNDYFYHIFHKDKKALRHLNSICDKVKIDGVKPCKNPAVIYMDTDSCYITFKEAIDNCGFVGNINDFVLALNEIRFAEYLKKSFDKYSDSYNTDNYLIFELESIAYYGIWTAKKKYVQEMSWVDGKVYARLEKIKAKGLEMIQSATPTFCRNILNDIVTWVFKEGENFNIKNLANELLKYKKQFQISDIEDISKNTSVGDYDKFISEDENGIEFRSKTPPHVAGAGVHNHLLRKNPKFKNRYDLIRSGNKVKWYYTKNATYDKFSFLIGYYPKEFALPIDYDLQFEKTLLSPINNIIRSMGHKELTANLHTVKKLF